MKILTKLLGLATLSVAITQPIFSQPSQDGLAYKTGYSAMMKLGKDIHSFLPSPGKDMISGQPISIETDVTPFVRMLFYPDEPKPLRGVWISAGFIDLVNNIAHAQAIDKVEKGYFKKYIDILANETGEMSLKPLPNDSNPAYWTEDMLNEQQGNFNSIVGMIVSIKLAHHYLGHYDKYAAKLEDANGKPVPINNLLTDKEWDDAFQKGVRNSLDAGCLIEGVIPFYEAFEKMKKRPSWASYFVPEKASISKMKKFMKKEQDKFLMGE